ncbi:NAD(P)-binding domain-containing protein [Chamaesiphon sp. OTE_8_metabat_110]|uniref:NADPH-dependent F420 reductase n=1 Tax=Chamaesiphon sp. OTE_8_metabat_110 TaxID=2964696 RepID=UPI00286A335B|nr:NAD(P)-binding domain-containing protein [Chamaesiphon sp. OTE_8_metabat_110]
MKVAIIGSGIVGQTLGKKLVELGHDVVLGTRDPNKLDEAKGWAGSLSDWLTAVGNKATVATFAAAAAQGEIVINATHGMASLEALKIAGVENLQNKILIDVANELDFSQGMPPKSLATDTTSLGEKIQAAFPDAKVVKTLNTMNCQMMVDPKQLADGNHTVFISGNDVDAKSKVTELLQSFGWTDIFDLGDITSARATEMMMPIWLRAFGKLGNVPYNFKIVVG